MISQDGEGLAFLLSMPRSGSTLLSLMLGSHSEVCCPPEPWVVLALAEYLDLGNVRKIPYGRDWAEIAAIEFLLNAERRQRGSLGKLFAFPNGTRPDAVSAARHVLRTAYQLHLDALGKSFFVDKTPRNYAVLELIDEIFPKAKKIILLRNPLDIFSSYKSTWEVDVGIFTPHGVSVHARDFCEGLFALADHANRGDKDTLVLRYEDLASEPEVALRAMCKFVDVEFSPSMLAYYENTELVAEYRRSPVGDPVSSKRPGPVNQRTVDAWQDRLDRSDIQALVDVLGADVFDHLGYGNTVGRLKEMSVIFPTEELAAGRRLTLMRSMAENVCEQPFSCWENFVLPLSQCQEDRAARLVVIEQQQRESVELRQSLDISEVDRAARLGAIKQYQSELANVEKMLDLSEADRAARLEVIQKQHAELAEVQARLGISEADRAARLEAIHRQQAELTEVRRNLDTSEADRAARLETILRLQLEITEARARFSASEEERMAGLVTIQQQRDDLATLQHNLEVSASERAAQFKTIQQQLVELAVMRSVQGFLKFKFNALKRKMQESWKK